MSLSPSTPAPAVYSATPAESIDTNPGSRPAAATHPHISELHWGRLFVGIGLFVVACWVVDMILVRALAGQSAVSIRLIGAGVMCGLIAVLLAALRKLRTEVLHAVATLQFAVALLSSVMCATIAGTWILQGEVRASYDANYPTWLTDAILELGLDDLFHSLWFGGLLILLAISLVITIYKHRAWRLPTLGLFLSHFGVITLVFAGMVGYVSGFKARMDLHEGMSAGMAILTLHGRDTEDRHGLGFHLRLDRFEVEKYPAKNKLYLYRRDGETYRRLAAVEADVSSKWQSAQAADSAFRVKAVYPDFAFDTLLEPAAQGKPGVQLTLTDAGVQRQLVLGGGASDRIKLTDAGPAVIFLTEPPAEATLREWFQTQPAAHLLSSNTAPDAAPIQVTPGSMYQFPGDPSHIKILKYLPDFVINDQGDKQPVSRSEQANNPALQIQVTTASGVTMPPLWLFANYPDFSMAPDGAMKRELPFRYMYKPGRTAHRQVFAIVAGTQELWDCREGAAQVKQPLTQPYLLAEGIDLRSARILPSATVVQKPITLSANMLNPVVEVEIRDNGAISTQFLSPKHAAPYEFHDHQTLLTFETDSGEVKSYRSHVTVIDNGQEVLKDVIAVNSPLSYGGYHFYQANYRRDDPTYSGFQVVHDPGLPLIWIGLIMISLGVVYNYYIRPRIIGRAQA